MFYLGYFKWKCIFILVAFGGYQTRQINRSKLKNNRYKNQTYPVQSKLNTKNLFLQKTANTEIVFKAVNNEFPHRSFRPFKARRIKSRNNTKNVHRKYRLNNHTNEEIRISKKSLITYSAPRIMNNCTNQACYPKIGNLLIGRKKYLYASSTCGLSKVDTFCILGLLSTTSENSGQSSSASQYGSFGSFLTLSQNNIEISPTACYHCDSTHPDNLNGHRIENIVKTRKKNTWWQSENGFEEVFIQFDAETRLTMAFLMIVFKNFPPAEMILEKSNDFGITWQIMGYFSYDCQRSFPGIPMAPTK